MPKTQNQYVADQGEVTITLSAANVSAIAAFTTAEQIILDGVVRSFRRTNNPERSVESTNVTGDDDPIVTVGKTVPHEEWELMVVDDYHSGQAGEWGTDNLSGVEIFLELFKAKEDPGGFSCTPNGGNTGDIETTLVNPKIKAVGEPEINADANGSVAVVPILISAEKSTKATHA